MKEPPNRDFEETFRLTLEVPTHVRHDKQRLKDWLDSIAREIGELDVELREDEARAGAEDWVPVTMVLIGCGPRHSTDGDQDGDHDGPGDDSGGDAQS